MDTSCLSIHRRSTQMDKTEILIRLKRFKKKHQAAYRIRKIGLFGSFATGKACEPSDIDIVVEQIEPDLFLLGTIKADLETEFGKPVDVIRLHKGMNMFLEKRISQEAIYV